MLSILSKGSNCVVVSYICICYCSSCAVLCFVLTVSSIFVVAPIICRVIMCLDLFLCLVLCVISNLAIISLRRERV